MTYTIGDPFHRPSVKPLAQWVVMSDGSLLKNEPDPWASHRAYKDSWLVSTVEVNDPVLHTTVVYDLAVFFAGEHVECWEDRSFCQVDALVRHKRAASLVAFNDFNQGSVGDDLSDEEMLSQLGPDDGCSTVLDYGGPTGRGLLVAFGLVILAATILIATYKP